MIAFQCCRVLSLAAVVSESEAKEEEEEEEEEEDESSELSGRRYVSLVSREEDQRPEEGANEAVPPPTLLSLASVSPSLREELGRAVDDSTVSRLLPRDEGRNAVRLKRGSGVFFLCEVSPLVAAVGRVALLSSPIVPL